MKLTGFIAALVLFATTLLGQAQAAPEPVLPKMSIEATISNEKGEVKTVTYKAPDKLPSADQQGGVAVFEVTVYGNGRELDRYTLSAIQEVPTSVSWVQKDETPNARPTRSRDISIFPSRVTPEGVLAQVRVSLEEPLRETTGISSGGSSVMVLTRHPEHSTYPMAWQDGDVLLLAVVRLVGISAP